MGMERTSTGNVPAGASKLVDGLLDEIDPPADRDLLRQILMEGVRLASIDAERLDLKIVSAAVREMRQAFVAFAPVRQRRKITVFGSARTASSDPLYAQARDLADRAAQGGWMVVTGAGPGIMEAAMEGAGRENSFGVRIRLPFENSANDVISGDSKLVSMKYFFTRKLMLMKESAAYVAMPGGFGTLDETMELVTLQQTGKATPAPVVLLDVPGGDFWQAWRTFLVDHVAAGSYVDVADLDLVYLCDDPASALAYIEHYYRNYRSIRWFGEDLVIRVATVPDPAALTALNERFACLTVDGAGLRVTEASSIEVAEGDDVDAGRLVLKLDPVHVAGLHQLIVALNDVGDGQTSGAASI